MSDMVERVTEAVRKAREMSLCRLCDLPNVMIRCSCGEIARAAIKAMREPDDDILDAMGGVVIDAYDYSSMFPSVHDCRTLFNTAINAALSSSSAASSQAPQQTTQADEPKPLNGSSANPNT